MFANINIPSLVQYAGLYFNTEFTVYDMHTNDNFNIFIDKIAKAKHCIVINMYRINDKQILRALKLALDNNIKVYIAINSGNGTTLSRSLQEEHELIYELIQYAEQKKRNLYVICDDIGAYQLNHAKYMIIDDIELFIFTGNFVHDTTNDLAICILEPTIIKTVLKMFFAGFQLSRKFYDAYLRQYNIPFGRTNEKLSILRSKAEKIAHIIQYDPHAVIQIIDNKVGLYWSYGSRDVKTNCTNILGEYEKTDFIKNNYVIQGNTLTAFINIIKSAKRSVYIMSQFFDSTEIIYLLNNAAKAGIEVKVLSDAQNGNPFVAEVQYYPFYTKDMYSHAKVIIVDNSYAIVGSTNFTDASFYCNQELSIGLYGAGIQIIVDKFLQYFNVSKQHYYTQSRQKRPVSFSVNDIIFMQRHKHTVDQIVKKHYNDEALQEQVPVMNNYLIAKT